MITLLDYIHILLVLVVRPVCLDDLIHTVNGARNTVGCDEIGEIPVVAC